MDDWYASTDVLNEVTNWQSDSYPGWRIEEKPTGFQVWYGFTFHGLYDKLSDAKQYVLVKA